MAIVWEQFKGGPFQRRTDAHRVSIDHHCLIRINRYTANALGNPEAVLLLYDRQHNRIGVLPAKRINKEAFPIYVNEGRHTIMAASFCRHFGISVTGTERFNDPEIDSDGMLRLDLRSTHNVSNRKVRSDSKKRSVSSP